MISKSIAQLALPAVTALIFLLSYGSQHLFRCIEPSPLGPRESLFFNACVICIVICYTRACFTDPGHVPSGWKPDGGSSISIDQKATERRQRWCRKCEVFKPPRAHHCKSCRRCIPKMDHHCPWTVNCVSYRTFPHFFRFLFYAVAAMTHLEYLLYIRVAIIWEARNLPSHLGPSPVQMIFLFILSVVNSITLFALAILFVRNIWSLGANVTTIEAWEIERHETLLRRAQVLGGYLDGPDGIKVRIIRQEFPYDIGILRNILQGLGGNPLIWLWPLAGTLSNESGSKFETNEFEGKVESLHSDRHNLIRIEPLTSWPPPDPDRIPRRTRMPGDQAFIYEQDDSSSRQHEMQAFRQRQQVDLRRFENGSSPLVRQRPFHRRDHGSEHESEKPTQQSIFTSESDSGEEGWRDGEGDRLDDFGVDESVEFYDEDNIPLSVLLHRQKNRNSEEHSKTVAS